MSKGFVGMSIPIIGRVVTIWDELLFNLRVYFDGLLIRKKLFWYSSYRIEIHLDVFVEVI